LTQEESTEYLLKHAIKLEKLDSGTTFLSANQEIADEQRTEVKVVFRIGANEDPQDKEGLAHFAEHMVFSGCKVTPNLQEQVTRMRMKGYSLNGSTNLWETFYDLESSSGLTSLDWGIQPGFEHLLSMLFQPLLNQEALENERGVILDESKRKFSNLDFLSTYEIRKQVFRPDHPMLKVAVGRETSIKAVTREDIKDLISKYYTPQNVFVQIFSHGNSSKYEEVLKFFKESWALSSRRKGKALRLPSVKELLVYEPLTKNNNFTLPTDVRKNRVWVGLAYAGKFPYFTKEGTAFDMALSLLKGELFHLLRGKGYGYELVFARESLPLSGVTALRVGMEVDKSVYQFLVDDIRDLFAKAVRRIIDLKLHDQYVEQERLSQLDRPISLSLRLRHLTIGLRDYDQIIRSEDVRQIVLAVTAKDLEKVLERLAESPKGCFITGDI
jgi:predicted Zn-dependent peptidase